MRIAELKEWYRSLHFTQKWFIWLILLRPLIDNFYYLKHISPLLSPLYIVGVLTPVLCLWSIHHLRQPNRSRADTIVYLWLALICFSLLLLLIKNFMDLHAFEIALQTLIAFVIFFFARRLVRTPRDLDGILTVTLFAAAISAMFFLYEVLFQPFKSSITRGMQRLEGAYADVAIYGIYVTQSILICCYFMLRKNITLSRRHRSWLAGSVILFSFFILTRIIHASTTVIVITILTLFFLFLIKRFFIRGILFAAMILFFIFQFGPAAFEERFFPLIKSDLEVVMGERDEGQIFHGRYGRWEGMWEDFSSQPLIAQLFGMPLSMDRPYKYITAGTHNDYLRIMFLSGFIGFSVYLIFLFNILTRVRRLNPSYKFLLLGSLATLVLYSISTAPNLYAPFIYVMYPIIAFTLLPEKVTRSGV